MIIGLTGYAQSGKDTVAKILCDNYGFRRVAFADKIRSILEDLNPFVLAEPLNIKLAGRTWDEAKQDPIIRAYLQRLGVAAREHLGEDVWVNAALSGLDYKDNIVVTDVRFINEATAIRKHHNSQIWRVKRIGIDAVNAHVSETQMDDYRMDQIFLNNGTIGDLEALVKVRMQGLVSLA